MSDRKPQTNDPQQDRRRPAGPSSIEGVEASDLAGEGRGNVETDPGHELDRHLPQNTGEVVDSDINTDIGMAGNPDVREADDENHLGRHQGNK